MLGIRVHFAKSYGGIFTAIFALLLFASQADAQGPIRRLLFGQRAQRCEPTDNFRHVPKVSASPTCSCTTCPDCKACCKDGVCDVPKVFGAKRDNGLIWITPKEFEGILAKLDRKPNWQSTVAGLRKQSKEWQGETEIPVDPMAYKAWLDEIRDIEPVRRIDTKTFAGALQYQLALKKTWTLSEHRLYRILNSEDSPRRDRQLARMERLVRADLNLPAGPVDWGAIDWPSVLAQVLQLLVQLLPLFL